MKLYGAIDLHSNNNVTVLSDEQDRVVYEKRLPNDRRATGNLPRFNTRHRRGVDLQLALVGRWTDG